MFSHIEKLEEVMLNECQKPEKKYTLTIDRVNIIYWQIQDKPFFVSTTHKCLIDEACKTCRAPNEGCSKILQSLSF